MCCQKNQTVNKETYLELLMDHLYNCVRKSHIRIDRCVFMQDGAPCHTAKVVIEYLKDIRVEYIDDWPGNSPDLNPIENVWAIMKRELRERDTSTIPKLEAAIRDVWENIDRNYLKTLADSFPNRLREVIARKGNATHC